MYLKMLCLCYLMMKNWFIYWIVNICKILQQKQSSTQEYISILSGHWIIVWIHEIDPLIHKSNVLSKLGSHHDEGGVHAWTSARKRNILAK